MNIKRLAAIINRQVTSLGALIYYNTSIPKNGLNKSEREHEVVVTMTSFPARFKTIHLAIRSLMMQSYKPDRIILYLDETVKDSDITPQMRDLVNQGLEIRKRPIDMKVHKKYYYAMKEFPDAIIVTADDDVMYRKNLIETLIETHKKYPCAICSKRVHRMLLNNSGSLLPYNDWDIECSSIDVPSMELCATGVGGVLYPPHLLSEDVFDVDLFLKLSPKADDLWLKYIETISDIPVVRAPGKYNLSYMIQSVQELGLRNSNVSESQNDYFIKNLDNYFKVDWTNTFRENKYIRKTHNEATN